MTITSVGYAGTVGDSQWANMVSRVGSSTYSVDDYSSFALAPTAGTRAATVAAGGAWGMGVYDVSNATATINFASVLSGSRWDLVVLRRTWATKVTSIAIVTGGATKALPPRTTNPGVVDEQPLYLVNVLPGSTLGEVVDLRCISGDGGLLAFDDLARSYLNRVGTLVRIGNLQWARTVNTTGSPQWVSSPAIQSATSGVTFVGIYGPGSVSPRIVEAGGRISLEGVAASSTANFNAGTYYTLGSIPASKAPSGPIQYAVTLNGVLGGVAISNTGIITFYSSVSFTGVLWLSLAGASWADKSLV